MASFDTTSDEELIRSAQQGRSDGFDLLYERYFPVVYNRVRFVIPESDIEDVTQEIFIAVVRSLKSFRYEARFSTWLRTLVNREVADYYRRRRPEEVSLDGDANGSDEQDMDLEHSASLGQNDEQGQLDDQIVIRLALRKLPQHYQEIILLRFAEGMRFEEIAQYQCQSLEATKSLFRRAIAALQNLMNDDQVSGP